MLYVRFLGQDWAFKDIVTGQSFSILGTDSSSSVLNEKKLTTKRGFSKEKEVLNSLHLVTGKTVSF